MIKCMFLNIIERIEDLPTLYQKKYKLIKEKNDISKYSDIIRVKTTDNLKFYYSWDSMLSIIFAK